MIVGNVEEYIARCLDSFKPIADEICVVRAIGNSDPDKTIEIALARVSLDEGHGHALTDNLVKRDG